MFHTNTAGRGFFCTDYSKKSSDARDTVNVQQSIKVLFSHLLLICKSHSPIHPVLAIHQSIHLLPSMPKQNTAISLSAKKKNMLTKTGADETAAEDKKRRERSRKGRGE